MSSTATRHNTRQTICQRAALAEAAAHVADVAIGRAIIGAKAEAAGLPVGEYLAQRVDRWHAKRRARAVGLAYWPAVARGAPRIDATAYAVAEQVMAARDAASVWGTKMPDGSMARGGWDSAGHYGLSAQQVARMWYAAGCRDSGKFRLQVFHGEAARKGDSLPFARNDLRGLRGLGHRASNPAGLNLARKAVAALGRLSAPLRAAALKGGQQPDAHRCGAGHRVNATVRIRDLNWGEVARVQGLLAADQTGRVQAALSGVRRAAELLGCGANEPAVARALAPAYPALPLDLARRMALGETPAALSGDLLDRKEAHAWAAEGAPEGVAGWLCARLGVPSVRSVRVARWLAEVRRSGRWSAMERERAVRVPGEAEPRRYTALSVLDEVQDGDILTGRDSVDAVLQRSAQRLGEAWLTAASSDHRQLASRPAWAKHLPRQMRLLDTPAALAREGKDMAHCVGGYANAVERGQCYIIAISTRFGRSTVELSTTLGVSQHKGHGNSRPAARNQTLLRAWLARMTKERA